MELVVNYMSTDLFILEVYMYISICVVKSKCTYKKERYKIITNWITLKWKVTRIVHRYLTKSSKLLCCSWTYTRESQETSHISFSFHFIPVHVLLLFNFKWSFHFNSFLYNLSSCSCYFSPIFISTKKFFFCFSSFYSCVVCYFYSHFFYSLFWELWEEKGREDIKRERKVKKEGGLDFTLPISFGRVK